MRTTLPVDLKKGMAIARDVSVSGAFLETDALYAAGNPISFAITFDTPGGKMILDCQGEVIRVEQRGTRLGLGVKIVTSNIIVPD